jgi:uncharacterized protein YbaR (Trm112 family)
MDNEYPHEPLTCCPYCKSKEMSIYDEGFSIVCEGCGRIWEEASI